MSEMIIIFGTIIMSIGIGALVIDYFQHKTHKN